MKRKIYIFSIVIFLSSLTFFITYSNISKATTIDKSQELIQQRLLLEKETLSRAKKYGKIFSSWLKNNVGGNMVPSAAAGVIFDDKLIYESGTNADKNTQFGIASLSKTFTAVLTLKLAENGMLSLDDTVRNYLPGVMIERTELNSKPVTIRQLLSHTSGMPSFGPTKPHDVGNGRTIHLPIQIHPAGFSYAYSNPGYELMQYVLEAATGKTYAQNMKELVFDPLGMTNSSAEHSNATGGILTTIVDLAKYTSMLLNEGTYKGKIILSKDSYRQMLARGVDLPATDVDYHYSLGWEVITVNQKVDSFYKAGRWFGEASGLQAFPKHKIAFIYLCNPPHHLNKPFMSWRQGLTATLRFLLRKITDDKKLCTSWPYLKPNELRWYEGEYVNTITGEKVSVYMRGGTLFSSKYGNVPLRTFTSNRLLVGTGRMLHNFVWRKDSVIGLALRDGYYRRIGSRLSRNN